MPPSPGQLDILAETPMRLKQKDTITSMDHYVTVTPAKRRILGNVQVVFAGEPAVHDAGQSNESNTVKKMTIFERLGWDDDYNDPA
jgi:hypothetical protein